MTKLQYKDLLSANIVALIGLSCSIWMTPLFAQTCKPNIPIATPTSRFVLNADGTAVDSTTGLRWMRCSIGQQWDGKDCQGSPLKLTWSQAHQQAQDSRFAHYEWRLASVSELSAIVELSCENPAINLSVFPNTPASHFWSGTPFSKKRANYWLIQYRYGENHTDKESVLAHVRLVSD